MLASVIVLNWNGLEFLEGCLSSLEKQSIKDYEIIFVDNGSSDQSVNYIKTNFENVMILDLKENLGYCRANNKGYNKATGKYIAFINNDTIVHENWLESQISFLEKYPEYSFCSSKMLLMDNQGIIDNVGTSFSTAGVGRKIGWMQEDVGQFEENQEVFGVCGGAALLRKTMLEDIGVFDEDFFIIGEDIDLSFRAQIAGYRGIYIPEAIVYHKVAPKRGDNSDFSIYYSNRNLVWTLIKNMPTLLLLKYMLSITAYHSLSMIRSIMNGKGSVVFKAKYDALKNLKSMYRKRKEIQNLRKISLKELDKRFKKGALLDRFRDLKVGR